MNYAAIENLMQKGMWDDAILECKAVLQVQPTNPKLYAYLGMCHYRKQEWEDAAAALRRATILDENYVEAAVKLAQSLQKCGRCLEAYDVCRDFLRLQPGNITLKSLSDLLERHVDERRIDGWERSTRLDTTMIEHVSD